MKTVTHNGKRLTLVKQPHLTTVAGKAIGGDVISGEVLHAHGVDQDGTEYEVFWTDMQEGLGGMEAKDWDTYTVVAR